MITEMSEDLQKVHHAIVDLYLDEDLDIVTAVEIADWTEMDRDVVEAFLDELEENKVIERNERGVITAFDHLGYYPYAETEEECGLFYG